MAACPAAPTTCSASADGCKWSGLVKVGQCKLKPMRPCAKRLVAALES
jgi:hypothetical protein